MYKEEMWKCGVVRKSLYKKCVCKERTCVNTVTPYLRQQSMRGGK